MKNKETNYLKEALAWTDAELKKTKKDLENRIIKEAIDSIQSGNRYYFNSEQILTKIIGVETEPFFSFYIIYLKDGKMYNSQTWFKDVPTLLNLSDLWKKQVTNASVQRFWESKDLLTYLH